MSRKNWYENNDNGLEKKKSNYFYKKQDMKLNRLQYKKGYKINHK